MTEQESKNIIIVGAGFAGITAALFLARKKNQLTGYKIILIDCHSFQLYTPALYEIASIPREYVPDITLKSSVALSIPEIIRNKSVSFYEDEITGLNTQEHKIQLKKHGEIAFDYLVFALGSETNYFDIPGLKEHSFPLKTFHDAVRLRNALEDRLKLKDNLHIVVGGGGASGVELVAEFVNFVCALKEDILDGKKVCSVEFTLVEAADDILTGFDYWLVQKARKRLAELGVTVKNRHIIAAVADREITYENGKREKFDILIWTGGVKGPTTLAKIGLPLSPKGTLEVNEYLQLKGANGRVFAIGDNAFMTNPFTGKPLIWNVPVAEAEGKIAAENISLLIRNHSMKKFVPRRKYPFILAVGRKYAIADLLYTRFSGVWGWLAKQLVEFRYLISILPWQRALGICLRGVKIFTSND